MAINKVWRWLTSQTLRGLLLLIPLVVTVMFLIWLSGYIEAVLKPVVLWLLPDGMYVPGMALGLFLLIAFVLGVATRNVLMRKAGEVIEDWVQRMPVIGRIYPVVRQLTDLLGGTDRTATGSRVVLVEVPDVQGQIFGIVLQSGANGGPGWLPPECDLVYLPMSYMVGGYTLVLPRDRLTAVDMRPGEAMQMIVMGGLGQRPSPGEVPARPVAPDKP
jgi:uncharacterized membrane protein